VRILVVNAGSSSLKLTSLEDDDVLDQTNVERWEGQDDLDPLRDFLAGQPGPEAVGHRVVHGGPRHRTSAPVDEELVTYLESVSGLAPLHNPRAVAAMRAVADLVPGTPGVAAFDTSFHSTIPDEAATYALPREWNQRYELRRYGFHGLSHAYASRRAATMIGRRREDLRIVTCHLGAGASLCAVVGGRSVDTTMGFTPLEGLVMQTRAGSVDPGLVLWLLDHANVDTGTLAQVLEHQSGLKGLSGTSGDLRDVLAARDAGDAGARLALAVYVHRLVRGVGAMTASAGGLDLLVFTGGMGEHSSVLRGLVCDRLGHLGVILDGEANRATTGDADVSGSDAAVRTVVVTAAEDVEVSREVRRVLG
jgi:acetate kinase